MIPIWEQIPSTAVGHSLADLNRRFMEICAEHREANRAQAFAFLLVDVDTPEFNKMLRDRDYWSALNAIAGRFLSVFTLMVQPSRTTGPKHLRGLRETMARYFPLQEEVRFPALMLFQVSGEQVSEYTLVQLHSTGVESAYQELRDLLQGIAEALALIDPIGQADPKRAFHAASRYLRKKKGLHALKGSIKVLWQIKDVIPFVGGLV